MKTVMRVVSLSGLALIFPPALYLIYCACFKKKGCVCPYYFWEKRNTIAPHLNLPSERCDVCWRPKNILSARNGLRWPYRFLGFLPPSFGKIPDDDYLVQLGRSAFNMWREPFLPESSVAWLQREQIIRQAWSPLLYRTIFWRFSLLRGVGRPVFCQESEDVWHCLTSGIVEKYFLSVIREEESNSVFLSIIDMETKESSAVLLDPTPPTGYLMGDALWFNVAEFFSDSVVLFAAERAPYPRKIWAYKYVPGKNKSGCWNMISAISIEVPVHVADTDCLQFSSMCRVGKHSVGFFFNDSPVEPRQNFVFNVKEESWAIISDDSDMPTLYLIGHHRAFKLYNHFRNAWRVAEKQIFQWIGNLCSKVKKSEDEHFEGFLVTAPRSFAPQNLVEDGSCEDRESSPGLFLVPGNNPPSLGSQAFRSLIKDHPSLLEESHQSLREIGIPPNIASAIVEHKSWEDGESNVIQIQ